MWLIAVTEQATNDVSHGWQSKLCTANCLWPELRSAGTAQPVQGFQADQWVLCAADECGGPYLRTLACGGLARLLCSV